MGVPTDLHYTPEHEWLRIEAETATIGITHHAQSQLGDVVFVELPKAGTELQKGATFGTVESVKAVSDLYAPISGTVLESNETLLQSPELVNADPYGKAWMLKVKLTDAAAAEALLSAADYDALVGPS